MSLNVSNTFSLRLFYSQTPALAINSNRSKETYGKLSYADSSALRTAIRRLKDYDFTDKSDDESTEKVKAFVDTYNYTMTSGKLYSQNNSFVRNAVSKMKSLSQKYADDLAEAGITVEKNGMLSVSDTVGKNFDHKKFNSLFSKDNKYMTELYNAARKITNHVDVYL